MVKCGVPFEFRFEFLSTMQTSVGFKGFSPNDKLMQCSFYASIHRSCSSISDGS
jgi:hypothetical protein